MKDKRDIVKATTDIIGLSEPFNCQQAPKLDCVINSHHYGYSGQDLSRTIVLQEALHRSFDHGALPLIKACYNRSSVTERSIHQITFSDWRDRCFQQGWETAVAQADALVTTRHPSFETIAAPPLVTSGSLV